MKVLFLLQPWASMLVTARGEYSTGAIKQWETRSWYTSHRGPLIIGASKKFAPAQKKLLRQWPFDLYADRIEPVPRGSLIGIVEIKDCITTEGWIKMHEAYEHERPQIEYRFGDYSNNRFAWKCGTFEKFPAPIPYKGELGIKDFKYEHLIDTPGVTDTPDAKKLLARLSAGIRRTGQAHLF